jgi:predicted enzyme related to lactoylglutathione lyase
MVGVSSESVRPIDGSPPCAEDADRDRWVPGRVDSGCPRSSLLRDPLIDHRRRDAMGNPIVHFEIRSTDPNASRAFYAELFGWTYPAGGFPDYTYVDSGVPQGTIPGGISPLQGGKPMVTVFAGVADVAAALDKAVELGGTIVQPATRAPGVTFGLFADPQGHVVGVASDDHGG